MSRSPSADTSCERQKPGHDEAEVPTAWTSAAKACNRNAPRTFAHNTLSRRNSKLPLRRAAVPGCHDDRVGERLPLVVDRSRGTQGSWLGSRRNCPVGLLGHAAAEATNERTGRDSNCTRHAYSKSSCIFNRNIPLNKNRPPTNATKAM